MLIPFAIKVLNFILNGKLINIETFKIDISNRVYLMGLPEKEDLKCYAFIIVLLLLILLTTYFYQYVIRFVLLIAFYWYISIPVIIISLSSIDFAIRRVGIIKAYKSKNSVEFQESFQRSTGENPLKNGKLTKPYKNWLIQKVKITKYKIRSKFRFSPADAKSFIIMIIFLVVLIIVFLAIYAAIFPEYRLPIAW